MQALSGHSAVWMFKSFLRAQPITQGQHFTTEGGRCLMQRTIILCLFLISNSLQVTLCWLSAGKCIQNKRYFLLPKAYRSCAVVSHNSSLFLGAWHLLSLTQIRGSRCFFSGCGMPSGLTLRASSLYFPHTLHTRRQWRSNAAVGQPWKISSFYPATTICWAFWQQASCWLSKEL